MANLLPEYLGYTDCVSFECLLRGFSWPGASQLQCNNNILQTRMITSCVAKYEHVTVVAQSSQARCVWPCFISHFKCGVPLSFMISNHAASLALDEHKGPPTLKCRALS